MKSRLVNLMLCSSLVLFTTNVALAEFGEKAFELRTDYAVPDAPAFKILNLDGSEIHRPTSVRDLAIAVSDFLKINNNITLPQQLALEFSPALLMGGKSLTITKYRENPWWYRARISIATAREEGSTTATKLAVGFRSTIVDKSDMRMDKKFIDEAENLAARINDYVFSLKDSATDETATIRQRPDVQAEIAKFQEEFRRDYMEKWTEEKWNAHIDELAFAALFQSPDSTAEKLELQKLSAWFTSARGWGKSSQLLLGARASMKRQEFGSDKYDSKLTVSSRLYSGTNKAKVFAEIQLAAINNQRSEWLLNTGGEMLIKQGFWIEFSAGGAYNTAVKHTRLVTEFEIKYGL